jgi:hypothetical protein
MDCHVANAPRNDVKDGIANCKRSNSLKVLWIATQTSFARNDVRGVFADYKHN